MVRQITLKDSTREGYLFRNRVIVAIVAATALMLALAGRLLYLQVISHEHFTTLSLNNRVTVLPIAPTRGLIYDRNGVILAQNLPSYTLEIIPERVADMDNTLKIISDVITVSERDMQRFTQSLKSKRRFEHIPLRFRLTEDEVARIAVNRYRLPGVQINSRLTRHYPQGELTAHTVGYVGRINQQELEQLDPSTYSATTHIGKVGVEKSYEVILHGQVGHQQVETNARGRILRILESTPPTPGKNLHLNIDISLQRIAAKAFADERGALVAIDPSNGAVLAMVSMPAYDSNLFVNGIDQKTYNSLLHSNDKPLFDRALRGQYPPGSTTKPFIGLAGLELNTVSGRHSVFCPGYFMLENDERRYRDWKKEGHEHTDLDKAIIESCDVYFYDLGLKLGIDNISPYMKQFGFGEKSGVDIVGESAGLMPSREWKNRTKREPWFPGETLITSIGQGFMLATPMQLAYSTATLANKGKRIRPQVVNRLEDARSNLMHPIEPQQLGSITVKKPGNWQYIIKAMTRVIHSWKGTAHKMGEGLQYKAAGKTGTAQVFGIGQDEEYVAEELVKRLRDHALFISFAPVESPKIAVAVIVENGEHGSTTAAPIARKIMDAYLLSGKGVLKQ